MEIKEVNSIVSLLMGNKANSSASVDVSFLNVLNQSSELSESLSKQALNFERKDGGMKAAPSVSDQKETPVRADRKERPEAADKKSVSADKSRDRVDTKDVSKKETPITDNKNNNVSNEPAKENVSASDKVENVPAQNQTQNSDKNVSASEGAADSSVEKPVTDQVEQIQPSEGSDAASTDDAPVDVSAYAVSLEQLAMMGSIKVYDVATGNVYETTGAELAAKLAAQGGITSVQFVPQPDKQAFAVNPLNAEQASKLETIKDAKFVIEGFSPIADGGAAYLTQNLQTKTQGPKENLGKSSEQAALINNPSDEKIVDQASKLSEFIGKDEKLDIKVSVKEEKFAYRSATDLVADKTVLSETVAAPKVEARINETTLPQGSSTHTQPQNANVLNNNSAQALNVNNVAVVQNIQTVQNVQVQSAEVVSAPAAVKGIEASSSTMSQAAATGSEFVNASKLEAANAENKNSFRDVYKGMSKEVVDQVKVNITKSAVKGVDKIEIQLKPEDLGNIEVKMQIKDGKLHAHIISSRPETMEVLQKDIQSLEKAFNDAGFQTDNGSLSFSFREEQQANQNQHNDLRNFIGNVLGEETTNDALSSDVYANQNFDGKSGVNIRV